MSVYSITVWEHNGQEKSPARLYTEDGADKALAGMWYDDELSYGRVSIYEDPRTGDMVEVRELK